MAFRGALLKPSERNGKAVKPSRGISKQSRYEVLKEKIRNWWDDRLKIGEALREIQAGKLYQNEYETFEEFCEEEFDLKRAQAYRLIEAAKTLDSLSPMGDKDINKNSSNLQKGQQIEVSQSAPQTAGKIENERQARALAAVPEEKRIEVLEEVAAKGSVTAKAITEVAERVTPRVTKPTPPNESAKEKHLDKTGYPIPDSILEDWQEAESYGSLVKEQHKIKLAVERALKERTLAFREINNGTVATLTNAWADLQLIIPYAVCPTCQGRTRDKCTVCKQRGFVSEFGYKHWFPQETIEIRERSIKK